MTITLRLEQPSDYLDAEIVAREAFWNLYVPGCNEHYLLHIMRSHADFLPELSMVAVHEQRVVGQIAYTRSRLSSADGATLPAITFGPVSVAPDHQGQGIGARLITQSLATAKQLGHSVVVIFGHPHHYCKHGFASGKDLGISDANGRYPFGMLALELKPGVLNGQIWRFAESSVFGIEDSAADDYDITFALKRKAFQPSQTVFSIATRAFLD